jgi:hypothetical protein
MPAVVFEQPDEVSNFHAPIIDTFTGILKAED